MMIWKKLLFRSKEIGTDQVFGSFQLAKSWPRIRSSLAQLKPVHMDKEKKEKSRRKGVRRKLYRNEIWSRQQWLGVDQQHFSRDWHEHHC
jgi:hypothetical protein